MNGFDRLGHIGQAGLVESADNVTQLVAQPGQLIICGDAAQQRIAAGDLSSQEAVVRGDEFGDLLRALNP